MVEQYQNYQDACGMGMLPGQANAQCYPSELSTSGLQIPNETHTSGTIDKTVLLDTQLTAIRKKDCRFESKKKSFMLVQLDIIIGYRWHKPLEKIKHVVFPLIYYGITPLLHAQIANH